MLKWTADFTNNPSTDYELIVEILYKGEDVGVIKSRESGLELIWFSHPDDQGVSFDWFFFFNNFSAP